MRISHRLALAVAVPLLVFVGLATYDLYLKWNTGSEMAELGRFAQAAEAAGRLIHELQRERGASAIFIASGGKQFGAELAAQRKQTDEARNAAEQFLNELRAQVTGDFKESIAGAELALAALEARRSSVDHLALSKADSFSFYTDTIAL